LQTKATLRTSARLIPENLLSGMRSAFITVNSSEAEELTTVFNDSLF
jgi:hypothetical protein